MLLLLLAGCNGAPSKVTIELRKQVQDLESRNQALSTEVRALTGRVQGLERMAATVPTLPEQRLKSLFTVHSIQIGRLSHGADLDPSKPGDEGLKLYLSPLDADGDTLKATGSYSVEAFDLAAGGEARIGRWEFGVEDSRRAWVGVLTRQFVLVCPWRKVPRNPHVTVKVAFQDELTGRVLTDQRVIEVRCPPP